MIEIPKSPFPFKNNFLNYYACNSSQLSLLYPSLSLQAAPVRLKRACKEPFIIKFSKNLIIMTYIMWRMPSQLHPKIFYAKTTAIKNFMKNGSTLSSSSSALLRENFKKEWKSAKFCMPPMGFNWIKRKSQTFFASFVKQQRGKVFHEPISLSHSPTLARRKKEIPFLESAIVWKLILQSKSLAKRENWITWKCYWCSLSA